MSGVDDQRPLLSVVIPLYNEEEVLPELYQRLTASLRDVESYELVLTNDGSRDGTLDAGVRLDVYHGFGDQTELAPSGRLALLGNPLRALGIKLLYATAIRPPAITKI